MATREIDPDYAMDFEDLFLSAEDVLARADECNAKIAVAESCTGGLISALFTGVAGKSDRFDRGFVTYSIPAKIELLGIDPILIERHGVVSKEVAEAMATAALQRSDATIAAGVTGFAGPAGPNDEQGLVWLAVANGSSRRSRVCHFGHARRGPTRAKAALGVFEMLREELGAG